MQFSRNWLKEFVDLNISDEELCDQLTMLGLEVDNYKNYHSKLTGKDAVIKLDLTPNRGDCYSLLGVAREIAALNNLTVKLPKIKKVNSSVKSPIKVTVCDEAPRYVGRYLTGVNLKKKTSPLVRERLKLSGIKVIDPIVDITNYVLLELGQPLHAFDANKIEGNLEVRFAKEEERITLLDENKLKLDKNCLVIADRSEPVALAGIMGGLETAISSKTLSVYLESAFFKPEAIRGRARKFSLQTDASMRFERGVDFRLQTLAIQRASLLIHESIGGEFSPVQEFNKRSAIPKNKDISLNFKNVNKILGTEFSKPFIRRNLKSLGLVNSQSTGDAIKVKVPSWRFDLKIEADLIEEIARLVGYNNLPQSSLSKKINNPVDSLHSSVRNSFKFMGYTEVITYSFIDESLAELVEPKKAQLIFVNNPISENMNIMRPSLLPGLLDTLSYNLNQGNENQKIFEIGTVFQKGKNHKINQKELIGGLISGTKDKDNWSGLNEPMDFFDLKGDLENVLNDSTKYYFKKAEIPYLHPGKTALLLKRESVMGYIGSVNPKLLDKFDIKQEVIFFETSINATSMKRNVKFEKFSRFPFAQRDLSFIVDEGIASSMITDSIISKAGDKLKEIKLFDVYKGKGIPSGKMSLTYALGWQASNRTLKDKEIDEIVEKLVAFLSKKFNAKLRS